MRDQLTGIQVYDVQFGITTLIHGLASCRRGGGPSRGKVLFLSIRVGTFAFGLRGSVLILWPNFFTRVGVFFGLIVQRGTRSD